MTATLRVWLYGQHVADLHQLNNRRLRLRFTEAALARWGVGARPLSLSLPLTDKRVQGDALERFCDNLLPEGVVRAVLEREYKVAPGDAFGLLSHIGRECAGAIQFTGGDEPLGDGTLTPLTHAQVDAIVRDLPTHHVPDGAALSASLGGIQDKVLLTRTPGGWAWPSGGAMSTHIIKPEPVSTQAPIPEIVRYEWWALRLARAAGLRAASAELAWFDGRQALVVERFDRADGVRLHQEDFTQSLGLATRDKYEAAVAERRLAAVVELASNEAIDPAALRVELARQVTFNAAIGNGDAHSKNYSVQIDAAATTTMSPLYDVAPVFLVDDRYRHAGHAVHEQVYLPHITGTHLVEEVTRWGVRHHDARDVVTETLERVRDALAEVGEPPDVSIPVGAVTARRVSALLAAVS